MNPKTAKTALLAVILLASSAGYLWHLQLYSREERPLRTVAHSGYETLEPVERGYSFRTSVTADNVTLTFRATGNVTVTFLKFIDDGEGGAGVSGVGLGRRATVSGGLLRRRSLPSSACLWSSA